MELWEVLVAAGLALGVGFVLGYAVAQRNKRDERERERQWEKFMEDKWAFMNEKFAAASAQAIAANSEQFMQQASAHVEPLVRDARTQFDATYRQVENLMKPLSEDLRRIEQARAQAQGAVQQELTRLHQTHQTLHQETHRLAEALKSSETRGAWGEMQLRRVVELAGMVEHCDFTEQMTIAEGDRTERPDLVIHLPNGRHVVVDAKTPLKGYMETLDASTAAQQAERQQRVAQQIRERAGELARKEYWRKLAGSPDFVVMFLPGEFLLPVALKDRPRLLEEFMEKQVVIATPLTLVAMLRTIAMGWREVQLNQDAQEIAALGSAFYGKARTYVDHMLKIRRGLDNAIKSFNDSVGALSGPGGLIRQAERLREKGVSSAKELSPLEPLEKGLRDLTGQ